MAGTDRGPSRFVGYQPNELTGTLDMEMLMVGYPAMQKALAWVQLVLKPLLGRRPGLCDVAVRRRLPLGERNLAARAQDAVGEAAAPV